MYLLKVVGQNDWYFRETYYEYDSEKMAMEAARTLAKDGVECILLKPYKRFEVPKPSVHEVDL
jgi:hypothetical protein